MVLPKILAMVICDEIIEDKRTNKKSLIGIFNQIVAAHFPARHSRMHIFFVITNGRGKYKAMLQQTSLSDMKVLAEIAGEFELADPTQIAEYSFELLNVSFPQEGKYSFELLLNGQPVMERVFEVIKS